MSDLKVIRVQGFKVYDLRLRFKFSGSMVIRVQGFKV